MHNVKNGIFTVTRIIGEGVESNTCLHCPTFSPLLFISLKSLSSQNLSPADPPIWLYIFQLISFPFFKFCCLFWCQYSLNLFTCPKHLILLIPNFWKRSVSFISWFLVHFILFHFFVYLYYAAEKFDLWSQKLCFNLFLFFHSSSPCLRI